jgi:hypothetical protein
VGFPVFPLKMVIFHNIPSGYVKIAMENGPFTDDFPNKTSMYNGFSIAMLNNQMVLPVTTILSHILSP